MLCQLFQALRQYQQRATNFLVKVLANNSSAKSPSRTDVVVYINFSKPFDTVVLCKLLFELECYGITGLLLSWIRCFLQ
jgi:hypothetical protein